MPTIIVAMSGNIKPMWFGFVRVVTMLPIIPTGRLLRQEKELSFAGRIIMPRPYKISDQERLERRERMRLVRSLQSPEQTRHAASLGGKRSKAIRDRQADLARQDSIVDFNP